MALVVELRSDNLSGHLKVISTDTQHLDVMLCLLTESSQLVAENVGTWRRLKRVIERSAFINR